MSGPPTGWNPEQRYVTSDGEPPASPAPPPPYAVHPVPAPVPGPLVAVFPFLPHHAQFQPWPPAPPPPPPPPPAPPAAAPDSPRIPGHMPAFPAGLQPQAGSSMPRGINYLYPQKHTMLHVFHTGIVPYARDGQEMKFGIQYAPCHITVAELIDLLGVGDGAADKCGLTECVELGDGRWAKGISVFKTDDSAQLSLAKMGWDEERGDKKQPVWLCLHQG